VAAAQQFIAEGYRWVVDIDLEKFFDRVNHDKLMASVAKRVADKRLLKLIRAFLNAGVMANGLVSPTDEGTPQGGPLSPLLSNLVLDDLDRELGKRGHRFVRYADDCNIYVQSERAGQRVMASIEQFITRRLKLKVNAAKSAVARPWERKFLGFTFTSDRQPQRRIAPKAVARFKQKVRDLTRRTRGIRVEKMVEDLASYLRGWGSYFGFCQTPSVLESLNSWIRRRLRCFQWKQWKTPRRRQAELLRRGVSRRWAGASAGTRRGCWRMSNRPSLQYAMPNAYWERLGLPRLTVR
jgi:RNA-directed DNA polymerase